MATNTRPRALLDEDLHGSPAGLSYLLFVFLPLFFSPQRPASAVIASVIAIVLFVPLYLSFRKVGQRGRLALMLLTAALGYALIPFSPGGNTFIIYPMAFAAVCLPPRQAIATSVALVAVMGAEFFWVMSNLAMALAYVAVVAVIGTMVVAGIIIAHARELRNVELRLTQDEVRRLATLAERERIGRDLHDLLGHTLSVVALKSELAGKLLDRDPGAAREQIREVESVARSALAQVREAVAGIRATGLEAELAAARLALLSADVHMDNRITSVTLDGKTELAFAMALREAVTNTIRHANASRVEVEVSADAGGTRMTIADDGRGGIEKPGNGLNGMRERLQALGGSLSVDSPAGAGTRLVLWAPAAVSP